MSNDTAKLLEACVEYRAKLDKLERENADLRATLDAIIAADERAVELWRAAHPDRELVIPDRGKLVGWLLEQNAALRTKIAELEHFLSPKL